MKKRLTSSDIRRFPIFCEGYSSPAIKIMVSAGFLNYI